MTITREQIVIALRDNPLIKEYFDGVSSLTPYILQSARQVLGEKLAFSMGIAYGDVIMPNGFDTDDDRVALSINVLTAVPYLWTSEQWDIASNGTLPRHVVSEHQLPFPICWFTFDRGFEPFQEPNKGTPLEGMVTVDAVLLIEYKKNLVMFVFGMDEKQEGRCVHQLFPISGLTFPDDFPEQSRASIGRCLAVLSFLRSPHIEKREEGLNRNERRALGHNVTLPGQKLEINRVNFLSLHRHTSASKKEAESKNVAWSHKWLVCGHHRNQWYAKTQEHKLIWISPYLKGPDDKPLKTRTYKVNE